MDPIFIQKFPSTVWFGEHAGQSVQSQMAGRALIDRTPDSRSDVSYVTHSNEEGKEIEAPEYQNFLFEHNVTTFEEGTSRQFSFMQSSQGSQEKESCFDDNYQIWPVWTDCNANPSTSTPIITSFSDIFDHSAPASPVTSELEVLDTCAGAAESDALTSEAPVNRVNEHIEVAENPEVEENGLLTTVTTGCSTRYTSDCKQSVQNLDEIISSLDYASPTYITDESNPDLLCFLSKTVPFNTGPDRADHYHSDTDNNYVPLSKSSETGSIASRIALVSNDASQGSSQKRKIRRRKRDGRPDTVNNEDFYKKKIAKIRKKLAKITKKLTNAKMKLVNNGKKSAKSSMRLKKSGKRLTKKRKYLQLYKCIILMLNDTHNKFPHISWLDPGAGIFKINNTDGFTKSLKRLRGRKISFANTSRSLRYYQSKAGLLIPTKDLSEPYANTRYIYQFNLRHEKIREALSSGR